MDACQNAELLPSVVQLKLHRAMPPLPPSAIRAVHGRQAVHLAIKEAADNVVPACDPGPQQIEMPQLIRSVHSLHLPQSQLSVWEAAGSGDGGGDRGAFRGQAGSAGRGAGGGYV